MKPKTGLHEIKLWTSSTPSKGPRIIKESSLLCYLSYLCRVGTVCPLLSFISIISHICIHPFLFLPSFHISHLILTFVLIICLVMCLIPLHILGYNKLYLFYLSSCFIFYINSILKVRS